MPFGTPSRVLSTKSHHHTPALDFSVFWSTANCVEPHDPSKMCPRPLQCINGKIAHLQPTPDINDSSRRVNVTKTMSTAHSTHLRPLNMFTTCPTHIINTNDILTGPYTLLQPTPRVRSIDCTEGIEEKGKAAIMGYNITCAR